ncbi:TonB-dependent receptor [Brevundimonas diminuta]|nr:TonB-dependent receptor [Brevundimonas diminuta]
MRVLAPSAVLAAAPLLPFPALAAPALASSATAAQNTASSATPRRSFDIPAQPLGRALVAFARQSGVQVMAGEVDAAGRRSRPVRGRMTAEAALDRLLQDTGLAARPVGDHAVIVSRAPAPATRAPAPAPSPPAEPAAVEVAPVLVFGYRKQQVDAVAAKRREHRLTEVRTSDSIGQQPDHNIADSLRRLPGVQTVFDEDEGRYVSIRGLNAGYTLGGLDGAGLATAERNNRQLNLESIPSTAVTALEVTKTRTPDVDGAVIGGALNLRLRSPLEQPGLHAVASAAVGRSDSTDAPGRGYGRAFDDGANFRIDGLVSTTLGADDRVGLLLVANYNRRSRDQERFMATHAVTSPTFVPAPAGAQVHWQAYPNTINRYGLVGKLEARATPELTLGLTLSHFQQDDNELRLGQRLVSGQPSRVQFNSFQIEKPVTTAQATLDWRPDQTRRLSLRGSVSRARFYEPSPELAFASAGPGEPSPLFDIALMNGVTRLSGVDPRLFEPDTYVFDRYAPYVDDSRERVAELQLDYAVNRGADARGWGYQAGAKRRSLTRAFDHSQSFYTRYTGGRLTLTQVLSPARYRPLYSLADQPIIDFDAFLRLFEARPQDFVIDEAASAAASSSSDYDVGERVTALYALAEHRSDRHALVVGGRWERTSTQIASMRVENGVAAPVRHQADFDDFLPSISLHYDMTPDLRLRLAYAEGLGRPNPGDLGAAEYIADNGALVSGNPRLRPRRGRSYDLALERYFDRGRSLVALNLFRKTVDGEIYRYAAPEVIDGTPVTVERPRNAVPVNIDGAELSLSVRALPYLEGVGLAANAAWIRGRTLARGLDGGERPLDFLPQQSEWLANLMVFYERGPFEAYVSYAYVGDARTTVGPTAAEDSLLLANHQTDVQVRYQLRSGVRLTAEVRNLTGQDKRAMTGPQSAILRDYSLYGRQFWLGASFRY